MTGMTKVLDIAIRSVAVIALALLTSACASTGGTTQQTVASADEQSRAERIFRYQSRVADALLDEYPLMETFADADPEIINAEARMTEACSPLTRAVLSKLEGNEPSLLLRLEVFTTINDCERAAQRMDRMLNPVAVNTETI